MGEPQAARICAPGFTQEVAAIDDADVPDARFGQIVGRREADRTGSNDDHIGRGRNLVGRFQNGAVSVA
jgi:hypothetical protein